MEIKLIHGLLHSVTSRGWLIEWLKKMVPRSLSPRDINERSFTLNFVLDSKGKVINTSSLLPPIQGLGCNDSWDLKPTPFCEENEGRLILSSSLLRWPPVSRSIPSTCARNLWLGPLQKVLGLSLGWRFVVGSDRIFTNLEYARWLFFLSYDSSKRNSKGEVFFRFFFGCLVLASPGPLVPWSPGARTPNASVRPPPNPPPAFFLKLASSHGLALSKLTWRPRTKAQEEGKKIQRRRTKQQMQGHPMQH